MWKGIPVYKKEEHMHVVIAFLVGLLLGAGLLYAFRGKAQHAKDTLAADAKSGLGDFSKHL